MILTDLKKRIFTSLALLLVFFLTLKFSFFLLFVLLVFGIFSVIEFFNIVQKISKNKLIKLVQNLFFIIFISIFCILFFIFSSIPQLKIILFILLLGCIASDIGGFIIGKIFKGPKLTNISPKKTVFGALGSIFFSIIIINILVFNLIKTFNFNIILIAICTSLGCQLGDLFFSLLKRKAKIKDTGNILPGHGGILDRLDGIFLGIPAGFISIILFY